MVAGTNGGSIKDTASMGTKDEDEAVLRSMVGWGLGGWRHNMSALGPGASRDGLFPPTNQLHLCAHNQRLRRR